MPRQYRLLHHRQSMSGGHWDLSENPIPHRPAAGQIPHGEGSLCGALEQLSTEGWSPILEMVTAQGQPGETFILITRETF